MVHNGKKVQLGLEAQVKSWATPRSSDGNGGAAAHGEGGMDLRLQVQTWDVPEHWPGPAAQNFKGSSEGSKTCQDGKSRADLLHYAAEQFFVPPSSQDQATLQDGVPSSTSGQSSNQPSVKKRLNPIFVEALMRWPTGLSGFERQATALTQWWQLMPSYLSALCSRKPGQQDSLF
jgi:hypothetical protein